MSREYQDLRAKQAESRRQSAGERLLTSAALRADSLRRAAVAKRDFAELAARQIPFSPFLEIGASRTQRSAVLMKEWQATGVATDISLPPLQDAPYVQLLLAAKEMPLRICCDMHHLPFQDNTFRFVFAYRTLHHVTNPVGVVAECYRVLGNGGVFFCNEEPMLGPLVRRLRGRRLLSRPLTPLQQLAARFRLHKLFWDDGAWERSVGIIEARFDINLWREALAPFTRVETQISRRLGLRTDLRAPSPARWLAGLVGGNVRALCWKREGEIPADHFAGRLICLDCRAPALGQQSDREYCCQACGRRYPIVDGVLLLFPLELARALYPHHVASQ